MTNVKRVIKREKTRSHQRVPWKLTEKQKYGLKNAGFETGREYGSMAYSDPEESELDEPNNILCDNFTQMARKLNVERDKMSLAKKEFFESVQDGYDDWKNSVEGD